MSENPPQQRRGFQRSADPSTVDKTMHDRKHLTATEVDKLMAAAKGSRNQARDRCLLLLILRHGLQVSDLITPR